MEIKNTPLEVFPLKSRKQAVLERRKAWDAQTAGGQLMTLTQGSAVRTAPTSRRPQPVGKRRGTARKTRPKPLTQRLLCLILPGTSMRISCSELQEENQEEVMSYKQWALLKTILDLK